MNTKDFFKAVGEQAEKAKATVGGFVKAPAKPAAAAPSKTPAKTTATAPVPQTASTKAQIAVAPADSGPLQNAVNLVITVLAAAGLVIDTSGVPDTAQVGVAYSGQLNTSGGTAPYSYAVTAGELPPGIEMDSTGAFSGTPTDAGIANFTVTVTDSSQ